jgi:hypothetical protein
MHDTLYYKEHSEFFMSGVETCVQWAKSNLTHFMSLRQFHKNFKILRNSKFQNFKFLKISEN